MKKTVRVVAAVIRDGGRVFATQRGYGEYKDGWEFPGGKIEPGETSQEALIREISNPTSTPRRAASSARRSPGATSSDWTAAPSSDSMAPCTAARCSILPN